MNAAAWDIQDHPAQKGVPGGQGLVEGREIPYQPWALATKKENYERRATLDPETHCYLPGVPRITYMPFPFQIVQVPAMVTMLFEYAHATRYVYANGTAHPASQSDLWMGDSRGRWDGDTLVVETTNYNDKGSIATSAASAAHALGSAASRVSVFRISIASSAGPPRAGPVLAPFDPFDHRPDGADLDALLGQILAVVRVAPPVPAAIRIGVQLG